MPTSLAAGDLGSLVAEIDHVVAPTARRVW